MTYEQTGLAEPMQRVHYYAQKHAAMSRNLPISADTSCSKFENITTIDKLLAVIIGNTFISQQCTQFGNIFNLHLWNYMNICLNMQANKHFYIKYEQACYELPSQE